MDRIPVELLHYIFINVSLKNKLKCMLVCRQWQQIIKKHSLLHTLTIYTNDEFLKLRKLLKKYSYLGAQVEYLTLIAPYKSAFDPKTIFKLFPNLRFIYLDSPSLHKKYDMTQTLAQGLISSKNRLQHIVDLHSSEATSFLLRSGVYLQLNTLEVGLSNIKSASIIPYLKNAPNIQKLEISDGHVTVDDLELLHWQLSFLKTLNLNKVEISMNRIPVETMPANCLTTLSICFLATSIDSQIKYMHYARNKYKSLSHISIRSSGVNDVSTKIIFPLIRSTGSQLKSLKLDQIPFDVCLFMKLDKLDCELNSLHICIADTISKLQTLCMPSQSRYIQRLSLCNLTNFSVLVLEELPVLKTLELRFGDRHTFQEKIHHSEINLGILFKMCPLGLESLLIDNGTLSDMSCINQPHPLLKLYLLRTNVPRYLNSFISKYLPRLKTVVLGHYDFINEAIWLPEVNLSYFEIGFCHSRDYIPILVTTANTQRFYKCEHSLKYSDSLKKYVSEYYPYSYATIEHISNDDVREHASIQLTFASVKTLVINSHLAC